MLPSHAYSDSLCTEECRTRCMQSAKMCALGMWDLFAYWWCCCRCCCMRVGMLIGHLQPHMSVCLQTWVDWPADRIQ
mgnify:CR=1 FL=1